MLTEKQKKSAIDKLAMFDGTPPHDGPGNPCRADGHFARSIVEEFGMSISDLRKAVTATNDAATRNRPHVAPVYLSKLINDIGVIQTAKVLGLTPGALRKNINTGECVLTTEVAAKGVYFERHKKAGETKILIARMPAEHIGTAKKFLATLGTVMEISG